MKMEEIDTWWKKIGNALESPSSLARPSLVNLISEDLIVMGSLTCPSM